MINKIATGFTLAVVLFLVVLGVYDLFRGSQIEGVLCIITAALIVNTCLLVEHMSRQKVIVDGDD